MPRQYTPTMDEALSFVNKPEGRVVEINQCPSRECGYSYVDYLLKNGGRLCPRCNVPCYVSRTLVVDVEF